MYNLIITIISIGLIAIAATMGIYYGGQSYQNAQINAAANAILNESQQILQAERLWATNNSQPDVSGMPGGSTGVNGVWNANAGTSSGISMLIANGELSSWPSLGGSIAPPSPAGIISAATIDSGCYNVNGYQGKISRVPVAYKGGNYIVYYFQTNFPYTAPCATPNGTFSSSTTDTSQANHPIVKIAKAINNTLNLIPSNADLTLMPYLGLPRPPTGGSYNIYAALDASGNIQTNYCYLYLTNEIVCLFGPS